MLFPHQFWPKGTDMFGHIAETTEERGDFFLFYSYAELAGALLGASAAIFTVRTVSRPVKRCVWHQLRHEAPETC